MLICTFMSRRRVHTSHDYRREWLLDPGGHWPLDFPGDIASRDVALPNAMVESATTGSEAVNAR